MTNLTGISKSNIYEHIKKAKFPKQINLGARAVGGWNRKYKNGSNNAYQNEIKGNHVKLFRNWSDVGWQ